MKKNKDKGDAALKSCLEASAHACPVRRAPAARVATCGMHGG